MCCVLLLRGRIHGLCVHRYIALMVIAYYKLCKYSQYEWFHIHILSVMIRYVKIFCQCFVIVNMHHQMAGRSPGMDRVTVLSGPVTNFWVMKWIDCKLQDQLIQLIQRSLTDSVTQMSQSNRLCTRGDLWECGRRKTWHKESWHRK